jgi:methylthioribose-1-phosphate isomerase
MRHSSFRTIDWDGIAIVAVDQTRLPHEEVFLRIEDVEALAEAICSLRIRGAMALGVAGGLGLALAIQRAQDAGVDPFRAAAEAASLLERTRPTAANLFRGIEHVQAALLEGPEAAIEAAVALIAADIAGNLAIAEAGASFVCQELFSSTSDALVVLTHCNAGALAGVQIGTALGIIGALHDRGRIAEAIACETRPLLQGARLTCWEFAKMRVPHSLIVDSAAAGLIARGGVSFVVVGADRIAGNGDVANKVGTFSHALAARYAGIPFLVAAPEMTIDHACPSGEAIPIEERSPDEVVSFGGASVTPAGVRARNPAFDVTPAAFVTAIITERRIIKTSRGETPQSATEPAGIP